MLMRINNLSGWFREKARRCSYKRYVVFTLVSLPVGFSIYEHSNTLREMEDVLEGALYPDTSPKVIFDQETQKVLQTMNFQLVYDSLIQIIDNELAIIEEEGSLNDGWRKNSIMYRSHHKGTNFNRKTVLAISSMKG